MDDEIDTEPLPPPPIYREPKVEDAYTATTGVVLPKKAKKFKAIFHFIGVFEVLLGIYACLFGVVTVAISVTLDRKMNIGIYAGICGVGLFLLAAGGLKNMKYKSQCFMITNMSMSFVSVLLAYGVAGLSVWRLMVGPQATKDIFLPASVAAIMFAIGLICNIHVICYCAGANVSLDPIQAIMYTNVHTGDQFVEYVDQTREKRERKREKRREKSFKKEARVQEPAHVALPTPTGTARRGKEKLDKQIPMAPIIRSPTSTVQRPTKTINETD